MDAGKSAAVNRPPRRADDMVCRTADTPRQTSKTISYFARLGRNLVSCPRSSSHSAMNEGDKQATENKQLVSRFRPYLNAADFGIGTRE